MIFKRLYLKNFLAVGEQPVEINFKRANGVIVIKGKNLDVSSTASNASGKSTIIEGVLFALYGKTLRKFKKEEYIINKKAKTDCVVEIEFDNVKIVRKFVLDKKGKKKESKVEFYIDNKTPDGVTDASVEKIKEEVLKYIGVSFETMCNILIFGQHNIVSFLDAGEPEKREIVENLMNIKEYNSFEEVTRQQAKDNKTKFKLFTETYESHNKVFQSHLELLANQNAKYDTYKKDINQQILTLQQDISNTPDIDYLQKEWDKYNSEKAEKQSISEKINTLKNEKHVSEAEYNTLLISKKDELTKKQPLLDKLNIHNAEIVSLKDKLIKAQFQFCNPLHEESANLNKESQRLETERNQKLQSISLSQNWDANLSSLKIDIEKLKAEIDGIKNKTLVEGSICQECFGPIDLNNCKHVLSNKEKALEKVSLAYTEESKKKADDLDRVSNEKTAVEKEYNDKISLNKEKANELKLQIDSYIKQLDERHKEAENALLKEINKINKQIISFEENVEKEFNPKLEVISDKVKSQSYQISTLNSELLKFKAVAPAISMEDVIKFQSDINNKKEQIKQKEIELTNNPYQELLKDLEAKSIDLKVNTDNSYTALKESEKLIPYYEFLLQVFGKEGIKSFIIDQIIPTLNQQIDYWMQILYKGNISVIFDKLLNVTLMNNASKNEMIFGQGSGGECRRIDLAIMLAFRQVMKLSTNKDPNILFFDEVAENMDEDGLYTLYDAILDLAKTNQVYVISHNTTLLGLLENAEQIKVQKKNGVMELAN